VPGYSGTKCETNIDDCLETECGQNGRCIDGLNTYSCQCDRGFSGAQCGTQYVCPTEKKEYALLDNTCYFFDVKKERTKAQAQEKCLDSFGSHPGRLFEPKDLNIIPLVRAEALKLRPRQGQFWWIGVSDTISEGTFHYDSSGRNITFSAPWKSGEPNNANGNENCVQIELEAAAPVWNDVSCPSKHVCQMFYTICELP